MDYTLRTLLSEVAGEPTDSSKYTHVSFCDGREQRWIIRNQDVTRFWLDYCEMGYDGSKTLSSLGSVSSPVLSLPCKDTKYAQISDKNMYLCEKTENDAPFIIDITLRYDNTVNIEPYSDKFLCEVASCAQQTIINCCQLIDGDDLQLMCFVLEGKRSWIEQISDEEALKCSKVRIQFPYCRVDINAQENILIPVFIKELIKANVMSTLDYQPHGGIRSMINKRTASEPVTMYLSDVWTKECLLRLTKIWGYIGDEEIEDPRFLESSLHLASCDPRLHIDVVKGIFSSDHLIVPDHPHNYWLPLILSMRYHTTITLLNPEYGINAAIPKETPIFFGHNGGKFDVGSDLEVLLKVLPMLNIERYTIEGFWLDIGGAFYNSTHGSEVGLKEWINQTNKVFKGRQMPDFFEGKTVYDKCKDSYDYFFGSKITHRTMAWYAREDSSDAYQSWHNNRCLLAIEKALSLNDSDIVKALYVMYWLEHVCANIRSNLWYFYSNHKWKQADSPHYLRIRLGGEFVEKLETIRTQLSRDIHESKEDGFKRNGEALMKRLGELINICGSNGRKGGILFDAKDKFFVEDFTMKLDSNPDILGVRNGVLEIAGNSVNQRKGKPEDYLCKVCTTPYHAYYSFEHPLVVECMLWFARTFPNGELRHYFLKFAASCIRGKNSYKIFAIFTGDKGNNSKSMIVKLFETTFGCYCIKLPIAAISGKEQGTGGGPAPHLARAAWARIIFIDEPEDNVDLNKGAIKRYTGGDSFFVRFLNENGGDIKALYKLIMVCNLVPCIPAADKAIKNRVKLIPFLSVFESDAPETEEEQIKQKRFKMDPFFEDRIPNLAPAFLWIMAQYYTAFFDEGLEEPAIVTESTTAYWNANDEYCQYTVDCITHALKPNGEVDTDACVTQDAIFESFKSWFIAALPKKPIPTKAEMTRSLNAKWGDIEGKIWRGLRIKVGEINIAHEY